MKRKLRRRTFFGLTLLTAALGVSRPVASDDRSITGEITVFIVDGAVEAAPGEKPER
jgi:hypothetical protein